MIMSYIKIYQNMDFLIKKVSTAIIVKILKRHGELKIKKNKFYKESDI